jgi:hypothetical protein
MVLTDVWKKFNKRAPATARQDSVPVSQKLKRERQAALEFLPLLKAKLISPAGTLHAGTMVCAAAWLTGTTLYRSFNFNQVLMPGTIIRSEEVNCAWEKLVYVLEEYNVQLAGIPAGRLVLAAMAAPDFFKPQVGMLEVQNMLQADYNIVMRKYGLDYLSGARVGVLLCSILIQQYSAARLIDLDAAAGIAAQGIFEAARSVPPPL